MEYGRVHKNLYWHLSIASNTGIGMRHTWIKGLITIALGCSVILRGSELWP